MRKANRVMSHEYNFVESVYKLQEIIRPFIKQIIEESYNSPDDIYIKLGLEVDIYKIGIFNKKTDKTIIKNYKIDEFLQLVTQSNKFEFEINMLIRTMLVKSEEITDEKVINM